MTDSSTKSCSVCKELSCVSALCQMDVELTSKVYSKDVFHQQADPGLRTWIHLKVVADFYRDHLQDATRDFIRQSTRLTRADDVLEASIKGFCYVVYRLAKRFSPPSEGGTKTKGKLDPELKEKMQRQIKADTLWLEQEWGVGATEYLAPRIEVYYAMAPLLENEIQHYCVWNKLLNSQALKQHFARSASDSTSKEVLLGQQLLRLGLHVLGK